MASGVLSRSGLVLASLLRKVSDPGAAPHRWRDALLLVRYERPPAAALVAQALLDNPSFALLMLEDADLFARLSGEARTTIARCRCGWGPLQETDGDESASSWSRRASRWESIASLHRQDSLRPPPPLLSTR